MYLELRMHACVPVPLRESRGDKQASSFVAMVLSGCLQRNLRAVPRPDDMSALSLASPVLSLLLLLTPAVGCRYCCRH